MRLIQQWPHRVVLMGFLLVTLLFSTACRADRTVEIGAAIQDVLKGDPFAGRSVWTDVQAFYTARESHPAWVTNRTVAKAAAAIEVLTSASAHGLNAADYEAERLAADLDRLGNSHLTSDDRIAPLAALDARITTALLQLGRDVALGRSSPTAIDRRWKAARKAPDLVASLSHAVDEGLEGWLDAVRPVHAEYAALQHALARLRSGNTGAATSIQSGSPIQLDDRIRQVELNLERWRWLPDDLGSRHLVVNIPSYLLTAREEGRSVMEMRVVVGKRGDETPVFSGEMVNVVFSPYWNVPESIVADETAPAAAIDSKYLARNQIEILRSTSAGTVVVDPTTIDWANAGQLKALSFRQRPGPHNALGHVKFLFPNPFSVYLHDTPADSLFAREGRAFSHGCVRVEEPEALAMYVLRGDPQWDQARIREAMHSGIERHVKLKERIPVHMVYFTVWVQGDVGDDVEGGAGGHGVQFLPDVYGYDARQRAAPSADLSERASRSS